MSEKDDFVQNDPPAGCYDPEHWRIANGMEATPSNSQSQPPGKPYLTLDTMSEYLAASGITVRLNVVTHEIEVAGMTTGYNPETSRNDLPIILYDELKQVYKCDKQVVADLLNVLAGKNRYNPVLELIGLGSWDGEDYLGQLIEILGIQNDDLLSQHLLMKWAVQCYTLLKNQIGMSLSADGMLALQGPQGCGKTSFVRQIGIRPNFVKLGMWIDPRDKDTLIRCTSAWIVELGEIETTLRSDLERLKSFITAESDEYRLPYARADSKTARRTSFVGTCNSERFLIDPTGSRRFWTIHVENVDLNRLMEFPSLKFWRQIKYLAEERGVAPRLTAEERQQLEERNCAHEKALKAQLELEDIFADVEADPSGFEWRMTTVSEFKAEYSSLSRYSVQQISSALDKLGYTMKRSRVDGKQVRLRELPLHKWGCVRVNHGARETS